MSKFNYSVGKNLIDTTEKEKIVCAPGILKVCNQQ